MVKIIENKAKEAYANLCKVHNTLAAKIKLSSDPNIGFLCTDLENVGSGGFSVEGKIKSDISVAAKEKIKPNNLVCVIKEEKTIRIKGSARLGASIPDTMLAFTKAIAP